MMPPTSIELDRDTVRRGGLAAFVRLAWRHVEPNPLLWNWHHDVMCRELERGGNLAIHVPPRSTKSLIASVLYPAWLWTTNATLRIGSVSYHPNLSLRHAKASRELVLSDWFRDRWPSVRVDHASAADEYGTSAGGLRFASSVGGRITGYHFDVLLVDDPLRPNPTRAEIEAAADWWRQVRTTRFRTSEAFTVLVMQRVHDLDPGQLAKEQGFRAVSIPMRFESHADGDPRTDPGALMWPERFSETEVAAWETSLGPSGTAAQLQQRPTPAGGLIFRSEWWQERTSMPARFDKMIISVDAAFTGKTSADYTVVQVWGRHGAELHLLDQDRRRMDMPTACAAIKAMRAKWARVSAILIEAAANGFAIEQTLRQEGVLGLISVRPERDKVARANAVIHLFAARNVFLPSAAEAPWIDAWKHELETFDRGANDDQVDATTMALAHLARGGVTWADAFSAMHARGEPLDRLLMPRGA
jgi:predicted phage terminase large subunit-like protein